MSAIETLKTELARRQKSNPRYSLRAFARDLTVSPAQLSQLLSSRRNLTPELAERMAEKLSLSPMEKKNFLVSTVLGRSPSAPMWTPLDEDRFQMIADWKHFAILSLTKVNDGRGDAGWIASRLGIGYAEALSALERLRRMKILCEESEGFRQISEPFSAESKFPSSAIRRFHRDNLELALRKLDEVPVERRDYSSMSFSMRESDLEKLRQRILRFQEEIAQDAESRPGSDVFMLACQLFPLTRGVDS